MIWTVVDFAGAEKKPTGLCRSSRSGGMWTVSDGRVRYARNGDVRLAYRVFGDGERTLVWVPGWVSNVDLYDDPTTPLASGRAPRS